MAGRNGTAPAEEGEQLQLIDVDHPAHKKILSLARRIRKADVERTEAQDKSGALREELVELLREHKLEHFKCGELEINLKDKTIVSVKGAKAEDAGDDE